LTVEAPALGVFDSGVGGLTVLRELIALLPQLPMVYVADQAHAPYGQRPLAEIRELAEGITRFLLDHGAAVVVVACNTASAAALTSLRRIFPEVPFVGMEPAIKPAAERTRSGHVGVIATAATFQGELFASLLDRYATGVTIHAQACPDLVPLVEAGDLHSARARAAVAGCLAPLLEAGIDELVLGCTHYPFLRPLIEQAAGPEVEVIDPSPAVARQATRVLAARGWLPPAPPAETDRAESGAAHGSPPAGAAPDRAFFTTGDPARFRRALAELLGLDAVPGTARWEGHSLR
jgi:glutamate racemase